MRRQQTKLFLNVIMLIFMVTVLISHELIIYGCEQGYGQMKMVRDARPIAEVLKSDSLPDSLRYKLNLILEIRQFAFDSLGINKSDNYTEFYDQTGQPRLLTVSACEPFAFEAREWSFPFLGTVSYKGFFNREKANMEIRKLRMQGLDVDVYTPAGWSTLGWFRDPVLSGMLRKEEDELADLIIHELTHGTLFVKNNVTFNENLASFIGDKGAQRFLISRFGNASEQYRNYLYNKADEKVYSRYILGGMARLYRLYDSTQTMDPEMRKRLKLQTVSSIVAGVMKLPLHQKRQYFRYSLQAFREGNAFFMSFDRYDSQYKEFDDEYRNVYHSDLRAYLNALKEKYPSL